MTIGCATSELTFSLFDYFSRDRAFRTVRGLVAIARKMRVIADSSPICCLVLIGEIELLPRLFSRIVLPEAVLDELSAEGSPAPVRQWAGRHALDLSRSSNRRCSRGRRPYLNWAGSTDPTAG